MELMSYAFRCLPLSRLSEATKSASWTSETCRSVERGAKLVLAVSGSSQAILQVHNIHNLLL